MDSPLIPIPIHRTRRRTDAGALTWDHYVNGTPASRAFYAEVLSLAARRQPGGSSADPVTGALREHDLLLIPLSVLPARLRPPAETLPPSPSPASPDALTVRFRATTTSRDPRPDPVDVVVDVEGPADALDHYVAEAYGHLLAEAPHAGQWIDAPAFAGILKTLYDPRSHRLLPILRHLTTPKKTHQ